MQTISQINYNGRAWTIEIIELDERGYIVGKATPLKFDAKQGGFVDGFRQVRLVAPKGCDEMMSSLVACLESCLADGGRMSEAAIEAERIAFSDAAMKLEEAKKAEAAALAAKAAAEAAIAELTKATP